MIDKISTLDDVKTFTLQVISEGVSIHPDDDFKEIISIKSGKPTYTEAEAIKRNRLMGECFKVCRKEGIDIYSFTMEIYLKKTRLDKVIPPPSEPYTE